MENIYLIKTTLKPEEKYDDICQVSSRNNPLFYFYALTLIKVKLSLE